MSIFVHLLGCNHFALSVFKVAEGVDEAVQKDQELIRASRMSQGQDFIATKELGKEQ